MGIGGVMQRDVSQAVELCRTMRESGEQGSLAQDCVDVNVAMRWHR
jgi:hypothetical protein